jgi:hypothetical protein
MIAALLTIAYCADSDPALGVPDVLDKWEDFRGRVGAVLDLDEKVPVR